MKNLQRLLELIPSSELKNLEQLVPTGETPIWKYWAEFVIQHHQLGRSLATIKSARDGIRVIVRKGEVYSIEHANSPKLLTQVTLHLQDKYQLKGSTRNTYIKNLNTYFIWLEKNEYITENKVRKIPKSTITFNEQLCLTRDQVINVFDYLRTRKFGSKLERLRTILFVDVLAYTGARPCELLSMTIDSIYKDAGGWKILIGGKKLKGRSRYYNCPQFIVHNFVCSGQLILDVK